MGLMYYMSWLPVIVGCCGAIGLAIVIIIVVVLVKKYRKPKRKTTRTDDNETSSSDDGQIILGCIPNDFDAPIRGICKC